jgi:hypothetical protein
MVKQDKILNLTELILMALQLFCVGFSIYLAVKFKLPMALFFFIVCVLFYDCRNNISKHLACDRYQIEYLNRRHKRAIYRKLGLKKR